MFSTEQIQKKKGRDARCVVISVVMWTKLFVPSLSLLSPFASSAPLRLSPLPRRICTHTYTHTHTVNPLCSLLPAFFSPHLSHTHTHTHTHTSLLAAMPTAAAAGPSRQAHPKAYKSLGRKVDHTGLKNLSPAEVAAYVLSKRSLSSLGLSRWVSLFVSLWFSLSLYGPLCSSLSLSVCVCV